MGLFNRKQKKILEAKAQDKLREERLDRIILNPNTPNRELRSKVEKPVQVKYMSPEVQGGKKQMLQVIEIGELSSKEYMLNPAERISIGYGKENTIVLNDPALADLKCEIGIYHGILGARSNDSAQRVVMKRKKESVFLGSTAIEIKSEDIIVIGKTSLKIVVV